LIAATADRIEADCEIPADLLATLHEARLFRTLLPRSLGGDETPPADYVRMMELIAAADASTAWCIGQTSGCSMAAAYMSHEAAQHIWGGPDAALAWGSGPQGRAARVDGGYRVTGRWDFASGSRNATWIGGHSRVVEPDGSLLRWSEGPLAGDLVERSMLMPKSAVTILRNWNPMGLRGTGSDSYEVDDLFVPDAFTVIRDHAPDRREAGPLYRFVTNHLYASGFGAVALGIARGALDAFTELARTKTPQSSARMLRDSHHVQTQMALATAKLTAARTLLVTTLEEVWSSVVTHGEMSLDERMRIRLAGSFATHQAREVMDFAYHEAGAGAIFPTQPFERRFRDLNSVTQQIQARAAHFETVGAHLLGLGAPSRFL
jgi:alkylation response protein AidB-like acyl-CoA dehydrogenase